MIYITTSKRLVAAYPSSEAAFQPIASTFMAGIRVSHSMWWPAGCHSAATITAAYCRQGCPSGNLLCWLSHGEAFAPQTGAGADDLPVPFTWLMDWSTLLPASINGPMLLLWEIVLCLPALRVGLWA